MSVQRTRTDCVTCSAWSPGVIASLSMSPVKSNVDVREPGCVNMRFHRGSVEPAAPECSARLMATRDNTLGNESVVLWRTILAFHCCTVRG